MIKKQNDKIDELFNLLESRDISNEQYYSLYHRIFNQDSTIYDCLSKVNIDEIKDILEIKSIPNLSICFDNNV